MTPRPDDAPANSQLTDDEITRRLVEMRASAVQRIAEMTADLAAVAAASSGSNLDDEHDPEGSTIAFEREQLAALRGQADRHLVDIEAALERVRVGRYGTCERCGATITSARLDALPAVRLCLSCAAG